MKTFKIARVCPKCGMYPISPIVYKNENNRRGNVCGDRWEAEEDKYIVLNSKNVIINLKEETLQSLNDYMKAWNGTGDFDLTKQQLSVLKKLIEKGLVS